MKEQSNNNLENELIELLISIRELSKKDKNFILADKIRDELNKIGIVLQDGKTGPLLRK